MTSGKGPEFTRERYTDMCRQQRLLATKILADLGIDLNLQGQYPSAPRRLRLLFLVAEGQNSDRIIIDDPDLQATQPQKQRCQRNPHSRESARCGPAPYGAGAKRQESRT